MAFTQTNVEVDDKRNSNNKSDPGLKERQVNRLGLSDRTLVLGLMVIAFISHAYNMFRYPIYLGDEGIYMEQAWAVLRDGKLAPYTYTYDHAPAGWLLIAAWIELLPAKFHQFGMAINSGRVLMLLLHVASVALLYYIAKKISASDVAATLTGLIFTLSPLGLYYQRMVLLDNMMVFWLLLSMYYLVYNNGRLLKMIASGLFFGIAMLTKENAMFFIPVLAFMVFLEVRKTYRYRFAVGGWLFTWTAIVSIYPLYALLKSEFLPAASAEQHVSLIGTWAWQLGRRNSSILDPNSYFWQYVHLRWWPRDALIIGGGILAIMVNLVAGLLHSKTNRASLVAALLTLGYGFYIVRGSVVLEFYLTPLLPFLALNIGILVDRIIDVLPSLAIAPTFGLAVLVLSSFFIYTARDHYTLDINQEVIAQVNWIRANVPPTANISIDDDIWVDLHDGGGRIPSFPNAHSYSKVQGDPEIRTKLLKNNWRSLDYVVLSDQLLPNLQFNQDDFVLAAVQNSRLVATFIKGEVQLDVMKVNK